MTGAEFRMLSSNTGEIQYQSAPSFAPGLYYAKNGFDMRDAVFDPLYDDAMMYEN